MLMQGLIVWVQEGQLGLPPCHLLNAEPRLPKADQRVREAERTSIARTRLRARNEDTPVLMVPGIGEASRVRSLHTKGVATAV
jgi:hypothetical protein